MSAAASFVRPHARFMAHVHGENDWLVKLVAFSLVAIRVVSFKLERIVAKLWGQGEKER